MSRGRLLTLVGPGGVGETRLAVELAERSRSRFHHGIWMVRLEAVGQLSSCAQPWRKHSVCRRSPGEPGKS